jgi:hypothetical protein
VATYHEHEQRRDRTPHASARRGWLVTAVVLIAIAVALVLLLTYTGGGGSGGGY